MKGRGMKGERDNNSVMATELLPEGDISGWSKVISCKRYVHYPKQAGCEEGQEKK